MKRVAILAFLFGTLSLSLIGQDVEYVVYKASHTQVYDWHLRNGSWAPEPDKYWGYIILEVSGDGAVVLHHTLVFDCWVENGTRYYDWWVSTWFRILTVGNGQFAIAAQGAWNKDGAGVEAVALLGASPDGPPKGFAGVHFTLIPGSEIEREEVKLRLDKKLTAAAQAAASGAEDPLWAVRQMMGQYLESLGYQEAR